MIDAHEYGKALLALAEEEGITERISEELSAVSALLSRRPQYVTLLSTPALATREKPGLIEQAFSPCHIYIRDLLKLLSTARAVEQLPAVTAVFGRLYDEARGILRAEARTAVPMSEAQLARLEKKLADMTKSTVVLTNRCDPSVIGGVTLVCDSTRFDGSLRTQLEILGRQLADARI